MGLYTPVGAGWPYKVYGSAVIDNVIYKLCVLERMNLYETLTTTLDRNIDAEITVNRRLLLWMCEVIDAARQLSCSSCSNHTCARWHCEGDEFDTVLETCPV